MMGYLKNPKFSIFINGKPKGHIKAKGGIVKEDPLSPFLFLLVSEVLVAIINNFHLNGQYEGFHVSKDLIHLPLLQFAPICRWHPPFLQIWWSDASQARGCH